MKKAIIFDTDGTLSNNQHRQHYLTGDKKDWDGFYSEIDKDTPNEAVVDIAWLVFFGIKMLNLTGNPFSHEIVFCTGRPEKYRKATENWLASYLFPDLEYKLFMRKDGDHRPDYIVKEEMISELKENGLYPYVVFDDRKQVVDMWRRNGITCLQCAEGDF